jgi:transposase, IS5 family
VISRVTGELADLAEAAAAEAAAVLRNGRRALPKTISGRVRGRLARALNDLAVTIERTAKVVAQARTRMAGQVPDSATRLISLHDPDARPSRKGRIDKPVEFGYKAQVTDNDDGIILDYTVEYGAAPDGPQLAPAIERVSRRAGRVPGAATADRGYGRPAYERNLHDLGCAHRADPPPGKDLRHPPQDRAPPRLPPAGQVAHRLGRADQLPQTPLRMGPHPPGRQARSHDLVRTRGLRPQPGQDRGADQLTTKAKKACQITQQPARSRDLTTSLFRSK